MSDLVFLKLGGSAITDKTRPAAPREDVIRRIAREIKRARDARGAELELVLGHGSGSFGHFVAKATGYGREGNWEAYAETGAAAARLDRLVVDILLAEGVPAVTMQPSASARCHDGELVSLAVEPIQTAVWNGLVPVVYGDVAFDDVRGMTIVSTEALFAYLVPFLQPARIILAGAVDGVFSADPLLDPGANLIRVITPATFPEIETQLRGSHGYDVTGGMIGKVKTMIALVSRAPSVQVILMSGMRDGLIADALTGDGSRLGTLIHA